MANTPTTNYAYNKPASGDSGWGVTMSSNLDAIDADMQGMAQLAGRPGGQILYGDTAANGDITIHGTSDSTRTTSYVLLQPTAGNVGIGTTAPSAKWHVVYADAAANIAVLENSTTGQVRMSFQRSGDTGTGTSKGMVFFVTATQAGWADYEQRQLGFFTNNGTATAERVRITYTGGFVVGNTYIAANRNPGAGNAIIEGTLGIGTYTADSILHASLTDTGTNTAAQVVTISHNGGTPTTNFGSRILWELESSTTDDQTAAALDVAWSDATHATRTSYIALSTVNSAAALAERVRITGTGNVGIGTSAPISILQLNGSSPVLRLVGVTGANAALGAAIDLLEQDESNTGFGTTGAYGSRFLYDGSANTFSLQLCNQTAVATIFTALRSNNNLGIGTTSPDSIFHVSLADTGTNTAAQVVTISHNTSGTAAANFGSRILWELESSTNADQTAAALDVAWSDATHATRTSYIALSTVNSAAALAERVRITGAGNVGIGTTAPGALLEISKAASGTVGGEVYLSNPHNSADAGAAVTFRHYNSTPVTYTAAQIRSYHYDGTAGGEDDHLAFATMRGGTLTEAMRILNSGNVGIGTTAPEARLSIVGTSSATSSAYLTRTDSGEFGASYRVRKSRGSVGAETVVADGDTLGSLDFYGYDGSAYEEGAMVRGVVDGSPNSNVMPTKLEFWTRGTGSTWTNRMVISSAGNVGIGTTSPSGALDVASGSLALVLGADLSAATRTNATVKYARIGAYHYTNAEEPMAMIYASPGATDNYLYLGGGTGAMNAATGILFLTAANSTTTTGTEAMRITSAGKVGIGTTAPETLLHVGSTAKISGFAAHILAESNASSTASGIIVQADAQTDGAYVTLVTRGAVGGTGGGAAITMYDGATTFNSGSLTYAGGNASGSRYLGILAGNDRDGNYIPLRFFTTDAGGTVQNGIFLQGGQTAGRAGFVGLGTVSPDSALHVSLITGDTAVARQAFTISTNSAGTAAAGFGSRILWELESSTTDDQTAGTLDIQWSDATHATRTSRILLQLVNDASTARWLHNHADATADGFNIFMGWGAGNLTLSPAGGGAGLASYNIGIGVFTLDALTTGYKNTAVGSAALSGVTTGYLNVAIGYSSGYDITEGLYNVLVGGSSGENITTGDSHVAIGQNALFTATTSNSCVAIGQNAGYYETGSDKLFIDNRTRSDEADGRAKALIYGVFAATTAAQTLALNAVVTVSDGVRVTAGSVQIGGTAARSGTAGTNRLDIFDGTAPVGTLANGVSIYSTSGECYVMDAGGAATLLSPHSDEINEVGSRYWVYDSTDTVNGKRLVIDMEKMLKFLNEHFDLDFVHCYE